MGRAANVFLQGCISLSPSTQALGEPSLYVQGISCAHRYALYPGKHSCGFLIESVALLYLSSPGALELEAWSQPCKTVGTCPKGLIKGTSLISVKTTCLLFHVRNISPRLLLIQVYAGI